MSAQFEIALPDLKARHSILILLLEDEELDPLIDLLELARETENYSGSDLKELCRVAVYHCMGDYFQADIEKALQNSNESASQLTLKWRKNDNETEKIEDPINTQNHRGSFGSQSSFHTITAEDEADGSDQDILNSLDEEKTIRPICRKDFEF